MTRRFRWARLLPCWLVLAVSGWSLRVDDSGAPDAASVFRISGIVVSSRDGSPVARCKMSVGPEGAVVAPAGRGAANRFGAGARPMPGARPTARGPGVQGGFGRGGRDQGASQTTPDSVITDATGHFSLTVPKAGMWRLTGVARGFRTQAYDEHEGYSSSIVLTAVAPEMTLTFKLQPDATITGVVFDEAGEPVRQAQVRADLLSAPVAGRSARPGQTVGFAQTDDRGRYEIVALAQGLYRLGVQARPWYADATTSRGQQFGGQGSAPAASSSASLDPSLDMVYPQTWFPAATDEGSAETVDLKPGEDRQADVHLTPIPAVHLLVPRNDPPVGAGELRAARPPILSSNNTFSGFMGAQRVTSNAADQWDMGGLAPGTYQVRLPGSGGQQGELVQVKVGAGSATTLSLQSATPLTKVTVNVDGVQDHTVESIILSDAETGQNIPVVFRRGGRGQRGTDDGDDEDDSSGASHTVAVPSGTYDVSVTGNDGVFLAGLKAVGARAVGKTVEIAGGSPTLTIHAAAGRAEVTGIASKDGKPSVGAMVLLVPTTLGQPDSLAEVERDQTNTDGSFVLGNVIPGLYLLVAIDHGWDVNWHDAATLARYLGTATPLQLKSFAHVRQEMEATAP